MTTHEVRPGCFRGAQMGPTRAGYAAGSATPQLLPPEAARTAGPGHFSGRGCPRPDPRRAARHPCAPPRQRAACSSFSAPRPSCTAICRSCAVPLTSPQSCVSASTTACTSPLPSGKGANSSPPTPNWSPASQRPIRPPGRGLARCPAHGLARFGPTRRRAARDSCHGPPVPSTVVRRTEVCKIN